MFLKFIVFFFIALISLTSVSSQDANFYLSADAIFKDEKNNLIEAKGNVEIRKDKTFIKSDKLKYNLKNKEVFLEGNVQILSDTKNVIFAEQAILNEDLKEGIIKNLGILLSDGSRLASNSAISTKNNEKTIYKKTVFTKCKSCKNNEKVMWQIKAEKASHLKERQIILYEGVILEVYNFPVLYVPFFYHPDPNVKRKTGLLTPKFSSSNVFGYTYEQPIYISQKKNADITIKPKITTKEGLILSKSYRKKFRTGELNFNSSITKGSKVRENEPTKEEVRGHIDFSYADKVKNDWIIGANIKKASDKSYLARYKMSEGESILTQNIFLEKGTISNNILLESYKFQTLSDDFSSSTLPFIRPQITYNWNNYSNNTKNRTNQTQLVLRSFTNKLEDYYNSLHLNSSSKKKYLYNGLLIEDSFKLDFDFYNTKYDNLAKTDVFRILPEIGFKLHYPLINYDNDSILEPIVHILLSKDNVKNNKIKNNDSKEVELTSSNLFEENKYSGFDRTEGGLRSNYGFKYTKNYKDSSIYSSFGRTFHMEEQDSFNYTNGFGKHNSDFVGNIELEKNKVLNFNYDYRLSDELKLNKNRFKTSFNNETLSVNLQYSQIRNFASSKNPDTEQINYSASTKLFKNWRLNFSQYRDLAGAKYATPLRTSLGLEFRNICTLLRINLTKDKSNDIDIPASTNLAFEIELF